MASHGAGVAAGSGATPAEASISGQTNSSPYPPLASGQHSWSSSTGVSTVPWSYPVNNRSQDTVYYDPQRDVSVLGDNQNVASTAAHNAQPTMGIENATHSHVPYSSSLQPGYTAAEYANCYNYPQTTNDSSILQGGANQHSGAAHQPLTSFQNSESYVGPTSNTYYNAGGHQTVPGYGTSNYHYQNNTWNGGSFENNYLQSYQNYPTSNTNAVQHSISTPTNSFSYQQQYNQWPRYYNHTVPNPAGDPVGNSNTVVNTTSSYSYPSIQPPPPGTTSWKSNSSSSVAPPIQASVAPEPQNQYINQTHIPLVESRYADQVAGNPRSYNHYAGQTPVYPQSTVNLNPIQPSNHGDQQNTVFMTTETSSQNKMQVPRIAPGFSMVIPKSEKKSLGADLAKKPAYVSVSMVKNDTRQLPFSLNNYATRNLNCCKDEAQRAACQSMIEEIKNKAIADGTLLTKNWDTEPLLPLLENVATIPKTSANNSSPSLSTSTNRRRLKSRWEPVVEEKVTDKSNNWDSRKFFQSHQATANKVSQQPAKKQKISSYSGSMQNGNASSDSDKEQDLTKYYTSATTLANSPEEKKRREHRSKRFEKNQNSPSKSRNYAARKDVMANVHARRAVSALLSRSCEDGSTLAVEDMDWDALTVKGTCQEIEKQYLRLTSAPDPATVRPEHVLEKALSLVKTSQKNYLYKCDQLKSIRQDLTVQRIQNELTIKVYETHARLAMQAGDLPEYNQCQSQLKRLYAEGIKGCYFEFSAYNLLCVMLHSNKRDLLSSLASLSKEAKKDEAVKHALAVHSAVSSGNYVLFFKLYKQAPNLNSCLMDLYVERMRLEAVKCMSKSYRPTIPVGYVAQILGFLRIDSEASEECEVWLKAHGAILSTINGGDLQFDTKASATTLYMPEPENAVSHGDASLAVNDFLARTEKKQL